MNLIKRFLKTYRIKKLVNKWNKDVPYILEQASKITGRNASGGFYWGQLVWQELVFWVSVGKQVEQSDFDFICDRRGFDMPMQLYIYEVLKYFKLAKKLKNVQSVRTDA